MVKSTTWRISCPPDVRRNQIIALEIDTLFVLRQNGPLAFSVQDISHEKPFEVRLGDPHQCNCRRYQLAQDLCPHICWIILKKFKISYSDSASFQRGMSAQELDNWFVTDKRQKSVSRLPKIRRHRRNSNMATVPRRRLRVDDTCAICLVQFSSDNSSVTYCKYSCGNVVHLRCVRMLLKHQNSVQTADDNDQDTDPMLKCPLCRGNFNTLAELKIEFLKESRKSRNHQPTKPATHPIACAFCRRKPILGHIYRCLECEQITLCGDCLPTQDFRVYHGTHDYAVKKKSGGPWRRLGKVEEHLKAFNRNGNFLVSPPSPSPLPSTSDYAAAKKKNLLEFSKGFPFNCDKSEPENVRKGNVNPIKTDRHFVKRNHFCAVCTDVFEANTYILATACGHYFHSECMEEHINDPINEKLCPLDNIQIHYSPLKLKSAKWRESKTQKETEINLGPLEVRVSRMHLEQRPKDSNKNTTTNTIGTNKSTNVKTHKQRAKARQPKDRKSLNVKEETTLDERLLSTKVNPLMTILMSPYLKQFIEHEEKRDQTNDVNIKRKSLDKIKVKSLEFPDECNPRTKLQKSRSTPSPSQWVQKTLKSKVGDGQIRPNKRCDL